MHTRHITLVATVMLLASKVYPYSHDGHYLVGAIADHMLAGTPTAAKIQGLIGDVTLARAATMADEIKDWDPGKSKFGTPFNVTTNVELNADLKAFLEANQRTPDCTGELLHHEYHFTDIEVFDSPVYSESQVGANTHDIVHMIPFCIDVLTGKQSANNPQMITPRVALVLLVHYVGDLHQPLHIGAEYFDKKGNPVNPNGATFHAADAGGNNLSLVLTNASNHVTHPGKLHHYWDFNVVEAATNNWANQIAPSNPSSVSLDDMAKLLKNSLPSGWSAEPIIDPATFAKDCANEILPVAQEAHKRLTFDQLTNSSGSACPEANGKANAPADYAAYAGGVAADEIQKGGHRLAVLLQKILK